MVDAYDDKILTILRIDYFPISKLLNKLISQISDFAHFFAKFKKGSLLAQLECK